MSTHVKVCGVRRREDALLAAELGACAVGFVFWPESPRFIDPYRARPIVAMLPPCTVAVGVFVDQPRDYVQGVSRLLGLGAVQLHGHERLEEFGSLSCRVIKAVPVGETFDTARALEAIRENVTVLLDAHDPVRRGGTGRTIDWRAAADAARVRRVMLSGGLHAGNVAAAVQAVRPFAVDVSSGVETAPGVKDPEKLRAFFAAAGMR
ncbi:MAG TPA: phosphoribosylanthranilate isomerase [Vicinamibacterales bacterium]|nr:phosphoribosylanthranilate isomerase [Vicinamibacterales bacterium]